MSLNIPPHLKSVPTLPCEYYRCTMLCGLGHQLFARNPPKADVLGGSAESDSNYTATADRCYRSVICPSFRLSHSCTLLKPLDEMRSHLTGTFDGPKPSNVVLDGSLPPIPWKGDLGCDLCMRPIAKLGRFGLCQNSQISYTFSNASTH